MYHNNHLKIGQDINVTECNNFCLDQDPFAECDVDFTIISPVTGDQVNACTCNTDFTDVCGDTDCPDANEDGFLIFDYEEVCDRNECLDSTLNNCDNDVGICTNIIGGTELFTCSCPSTGYNDINNDGTECIDIDECADGTAECDENASCINIPGTFICECNQGYQDIDGSGICVDIDECSDSELNECDTLAPGSTCTNTDGSYICDCPAVNTVCDDGQEFKCGFTFSFGFGGRRRRRFSYGFGRKKYFCGCVDAGYNIPYTDFSIIGIILFISLLFNCCSLLRRINSCRKNNHKDYDVVKSYEIGDDKEVEVINVQN